MARKILLVDDEPLILKGLKYSLEQDGYLTDSAMDGEEALAKFFAGEYDLILLDVMLPGLDGWGVCRAIRAESQTPIIMLTAKSETEDKVNGLKQGADDYITKPFEMKEVLARIEAVLRRGTAAEPAAHTAVDGLVVDPVGREVRVDGQLVELTYTEFELLSYLMTNAGVALSRDKILDSVWRYDYYGDARTVDTHVKKLRSKLGRHGECIKTIRGIGYKFEAP